MLHPHWFINRPPPGHVFNDDEVPVLRNPKMRNNKTDQLRALKRTQKGKKRRGAKGADRILSSFELECNDYAPAPTYEDQQTAVSEARRQLTLEEIVEKHRKQRLEQLAASTIVPAPDQSENSLNSFVFSATKAHPSMRAVHREAAPSPSSNRLPVTTPTTPTRPIPTIAQGQYRFQLETPQLRQTTLTQQPQFKPSPLRALNQPNRTTTPAPRLPTAPPRFASNCPPSNTSSPLRNLLPSPATPARQFRQPSVFDTPVQPQLPVQPQFQRASMGSMPSFTQQFAEGQFTQAGGHTSTQLGLERLRNGPDSYVPGTRPPRACDISAWRQRQEAQANMPLQVRKWNGVTRRVWR
ncbi:hypothetical protein NA56DRAFT_641624 [Hyaloscypha hepaticicola]|uniref:Uncharacterized protein n=1 Tax=Hyaloscypha hepaticicola TaxID=2082293 RepID=A0A2J6QIK2_9HELO|nr:hypothetical protein NA56DRAFT_641624 [Hyaloscypha hepaticicola]